MKHISKQLFLFTVIFSSCDLATGGVMNLFGASGRHSLPAFLLVAWSTTFSGVLSITKEEVNQHLDMGKKLLSSGQVADALSHYHAAVEGDPSNYLTYFRRATVYLALGKSKSALPDLDKVLQLKPDFTAARLQRGNVKLKQGSLDEAFIDFENVLAKESGNVEAGEKLALIEPVRHSIDEAHELIEGQEYQEAAHQLTHAIEICPWDPNLREMRADCYINMGDYIKAISDIRPTTKLRNDNTGAYYKLSRLNYDMGEADEALMEIRECLKLDPDHKECFPFYKIIKKLVKQQKMIFDFIQQQRWDDCINKANTMLKTEGKVYPHVLRAKLHKCHCNSKAGKVAEAYKSCDDVLSMDSNNIEALCDKAEAMIIDEKYEEAVSQYQKAESVGQNLNRVEEGLKRAQKLLKQSKKRDYYKILGIKRNASKKDILSAYRKLAIKWHPDKFSEGSKATAEDVKHAEKMFIDIAAAKEVLSDPEKRQKFDNGEDPLDAEEQANQGQGFPGGFNPFQNFQGGNFKFHFG